MLKLVQEKGARILVLGVLVSGIISEQISAIEEITVRLPTGFQVVLCLVPGGPFLMGREDSIADQAPVHNVELDGFYIDKFEVSNAQYAEFLATTGYHPPHLWHQENYNAPEQPVLDVNWFEMKQFCEWAGKRLPTEAEWEKAARGTDGRLNPWGNQSLKEDDIYRANYNEFGDRDADGFTFSAPVGSFPKGISPYGVYDMIGNAKEWVADWYGADYYSQSIEANPAGPDNGQLKVLRGGSWFDFPTYAYGSYRTALNPDLPDGDIGGRCVISVATVKAGLISVVEGTSWGTVKQEIIEVK